MFIPVDLIPYNDISITPKKVKIIIEQLLDIEINRYDHIKDFYNLLKSIKKNILEIISKTSTWNKELLSLKHCMHIFGENSKKFGNVCGSRIDIKCIENKYLCSQHIGKTHNPKPMFPKERQCNGITKYKQKCKKEGVNNGYCKFHTKDIYIEKLENENKILNNEKIIKNSINVDSLYNIIEKIKDNLEFTENGKNIEKNVNSEYFKESINKTNIEIYRDIFKNNLKISNLNHNIKYFKEKLEIIKKIEFYKHKNKFINNRYIENVLMKQHQQQNQHKYKSIFYFLPQSPITNKNFFHFFL